MKEFTIAFLVISLEFVYTKKSLGEYILNNNIDVLFSFPREMSHQFNQVNMTSDVIRAGQVLKQASRKKTAVPRDIIL